MKKIIRILPFILILAAMLSIAVFAEDEFDVTITAIELNGAKTKVTVRGEISPEYLTEHDGMDVYLMEMKAWNGTVLPADAKPVAQTKLSDVQFKLECGFVTASDRYDSFIVAVKDGAGYTAISEARFIEDPSIFSSVSSSYPGYATKKGLVSGDISDIVMTGSAQTVIDVRADELMLPGYTENSTAFTYSGNTYYVDRASLDALDARVKALNGAGVNVFARISLSGVRRGAGRLDSLYFSDSPDGAAAYALNTGSESATALYTAFIDFIAQRYAAPNGGEGFIGSWIVGYYADDPSCSARGDITEEQYIECYQRTLRLTDTAVRSVWKNARVYVPVSNEWSGSAKIFLGALAAEVRSHGDLPWRAAVCAAPSDRSSAKVWEDTWATEGEDTKYLTVKNISVLSDFLGGEDIAFNGQPRNYAVIEFAVNASPDSPGDMTPAASFAYAYFKVVTDERSDAFIWSCARDEEYAEDLQEPETTVSDTEGSDDGEKDEKDEKDEKSENEDGKIDETVGSSDAGATDSPKQSSKLYLGLSTSSGAKKPVYDVFTAIDAALPSDPNYKTGDAASFALSIVGTPDWKNVAPAYDRDAVEKYNYIAAMPILSSDISGRIKTTSSFGFETGTGNFYTAGAQYIELRTADGPSGNKSAMLYAGMADNGGSERAGVACPMALAAADAKYVSFQIYVAAPSDVASVAVNVSLSASGAEKNPTLFVGTATVKPNSWQEITFRSEDIASLADTVDTLSVFASSYDGLDHAGSWGMMIDDLVTYGAKTSKLLPIIGALLIGALVIAVILAVLIFILRARNVRRAKAAFAARRAPAQRRPQDKGEGPQNR